MKKSCPKTYFWFVVLLLGLRVHAQDIAPAAAVVVQQPQVVERGPSHRVWQWVTEQRLTDGSAILQTNAYTEVGTGSCYWKEGQWWDTNPSFKLFPGGLLPRKGPSSLSWPRMSRWMGVWIC